MGDPIGQLPVVGQQQQSLGVDVEATDGEDARFVWHLFEHGRPSVRVTRRRDHTDGLVEQVVDETRPHTDRRTVDFDPIDVGVDAATENGDRAVHRHAAGRDEVLAHAAAAVAGGGEHLLQTLALRQRRAGLGHLLPQRRLGRAIGHGSVV